MKPLRVCHVITQLELGGAQQNTLYTVGHLDRQRFAPSLIAGVGGELDPEAKALDLPFLQIPELVRPIAPQSDAIALKKLTEGMHELRPDIVHTHSSKAGVLGRVAAALAGVPVIVHTVHGWGFHPGQTAAKRSLFVALEKMVTPLTTQLVAVSRANAATGQEYGIAAEAAFEIIHSGVELRRFREAQSSGALRRELGLQAHAPLVGMVACLKPQKRPEHFVAIAKHVLQRVTDAHFVLAGDGELRETVERAVSDAGLASQFHLLGWRRDPEAVVGDLDVLVLTSRHEGLPRVCPEAMSAGKPIVATAVDGTPEAVAHGVNGYVHPFGDIDAMAASVTKLLLDRDLAQRFGDAGRARAQAWDIDLMVRRQARLYETLAAAVRA